VTSDATHFYMQLAGIPSSLQHVAVINGRNTPPLPPRIRHIYPYLVLLAPTPTYAAAAAAAASDPHLFNHEKYGSWSIDAAQGVLRQPVAQLEAAISPEPLALSQLLSLVVDILVVTLPMSFPLSASCAVTLYTSHLSLRGEHAAAANIHEQVLPQHSLCLMRI